MYFTTLPDHAKPGFDEELHFSKFRKQNIIFNALSQTSQCERHVGCLSIKTVLSGEERYGVNGRQISVRPQQFLMLNNEQEYSCRIDSPVKTQVLSVFFRKDFAASVIKDFFNPEERLLENHLADCKDKSLEFIQTLNSIDIPLQTKILGLISVLDENGYHSEIVDEQLIFLLRDLIRINDMERARSVGVNGVKMSTRKEIHKRLNVAKDLMHSNLITPPSLAAIGREACLSVPQLVRQFKAVFRLTPYQYLISLRLDHAAYLLRNTTLPVHEITWRCGFENASAFCRAFKTRFGRSPNVYRSSLN